MNARGNSRPFGAGRLLLFIILAVLLTGCARTSFQSTFNGDGSASHQIAITLPREQFEEAEQGDAADVIASLRERTDAAGLRVSRTLTAESVTIHIVSDTTNALEVGGALNSLVNATGITAEPGINAPFIGEFRQEKGALGGSSYVLDLTVNGEQLFQGLYQFALVIEPSLSEDQFREALTIDYVAQLPGQIDETTGDQIDNHTVRWEIPFDRTIELRATSSTSPQHAAMLFIGGGVAVLILLLAIGLASGLILIQWRRLTAHLARISATLPRGSTITAPGIWVSQRLSGLVRRLWARAGSTEPAPIRGLTPPVDEDEEEQRDGPESEGA